MSYLKQAVHKMRIGLRAFTTVAGLLLGLTLITLAITPQDIVKFTAGVVTGGAAPAPDPDPLSIRHEPISRVSLSNQQMTIIQGEVGTVLPPPLIDFSNRLKPGVSPPDSNLGDILVQIFVRFRQVSPEGRTLAVVSDPIDLPKILGPDPFGFAYQIAPNFVNGEGRLQYQIIANKMRVESSSMTNISTTTFPADALGSPGGQWVNVGIFATAPAEIGPEGGRVVLKNGNPNDGETILDIPAGLFGAPTVVSVSEVPYDNNIPALEPWFPAPEAVYRIDTEARFNGKLQLTVLYPDFVFPEGQDGKLNISEAPENTATIVWWDGFEWRRIGGRGNGDINTVKAIVTQSSLYAVVSAPPLTPKERRPMERIITPNGDGINDFALFSLGDITGNVAVEIFDISNRRVRTMFSQNTFTWDGRDDSGKIVESGVYIYQYVVDGERISGLIAVAK